MDQLLEPLMASMHPLLLATTIAISIMVLGKAADFLVDEAVSLSEKSRIPKVVIGATIVSLGTTMPEAAVSVLAALRGSPGLALGNAVGSIICDTGLILGIASVIAPLKLNRQIVNRQGWVQVGAVIALVLCCWPYSTPAAAVSTGGRLSQWVGFAFLVGLALYIYQSIRWARLDRDSYLLEEFEKDVRLSTPLIVLRLLGAIALVLVSAMVLVPAVGEASRRMGVPESIVAATLVAFGTSLPELVTAIKASRRGHGELAVGNIIGADILNVLFVAGASAAVTPQGLVADPHFFQILFPGMLFVVLVFRVGVVFSGEAMRRPFGIILLVTYAIVTLLSHLQGG